MSTTVLLRLTSFEKIGGQRIFGGASDFSNLLAPWASGSRSLMLRAVSKQVPHANEANSSPMPSSIIIIIIII